MLLDRAINGRKIRNRFIIVVGGFAGAFAGWERSGFLVDPRVFDDPFDGIGIIGEKAVNVFQIE